jgi:hypothetical protein
MLDSFGNDMQDSPTVWNLVCRWPHECVAKDNVKLSVTSRQMWLGWRNEGEWAKHIVSVQRSDLYEEFEERDIVEDNLRLEQIVKWVMKQQGLEGDVDCSCLT